MFEKVSCLVICGNDSCFLKKKSGYCVAMSRSFCQNLHPFYLKIRWAYLYTEAMIRSLLVHSSEQVGI